MDICMWIYIHTYIYIYMYINIYIYTYKYKYICIQYIFIHIYIIYMYMYMYIYLYVYMYIYIFIYMLYIYIYVNVSSIVTWFTEQGADLWHMYIHIYLYLHICVCIQKSALKSCYKAHWVKTWLVRMPTFSGNIVGKRTIYYIYVYMNKSWLYSHLIKEIGYSDMTFENAYLSGGEIL